VELCQQLNPLGVSLAKVLLLYLKNFCAKTVQETKVFLFEQRQLDVVGFFHPLRRGWFSTICLYFEILFKPPRNCPALSHDPIY